MVKAGCIKLISAASLVSGTNRFVVSLTYARALIVSCPRARAAVVTLLCERTNKGDAAIRDAANEARRDDEQLHTKAR